MQSTLEFNDDDGDALSLDSDQGYSSELDSESVNTSSASRDGKDAEEKERLVHRESEQVFKLKIMVIIVMVLAAVVVSVIVYLVVRGAEIDEFESQYDTAADQLLDSFHKHLEEILSGISSLVVATTGHSADHFKNWPFIALSWFQERSVIIRHYDGALMVSLNPRVTSEERGKWENYTLTDEFDTAWYEDGIAIQEASGYENFGLSPRLLQELPYTSLDPELDVSGGIANKIFHVNENGEASVDTEMMEYLPTWQTAPVFGRTLVNENILQDPAASGPARASLVSKAVTFGAMESAPAGNSSDTNPKTSFYAALMSVSDEQERLYEGDPVTRIFFPITSSFQSGRTIVGSIVTLIHWGSFIRNVLSAGVTGIYVVVANTCGEKYTYKVQGPDVEIVGVGDFHESKFSYLERAYYTAEGIPKIEDGTREGTEINQGQCTYDVHVYPSQEFHDSTNANTSIIVTFAVGMVFVFTATMFLVYDRLVERRQRIILSKAEQTDAIVSSLFPKAVRERLMGTGDDKKREKTKREEAGMVIRREMAHDTTASAAVRPNADLFPHATVLFADISGFTAWSSTRDPAQVFTLLEAIYNSFDRIAKKRKVFKVETIGDCYVAATGLPEPQEDHAVIMAKFASECLTKMRHVTRDLETTLGPDTGDLSMRIGIHSGPVTAGVLRGERARFQLFGDTVNTAARMESTGARDKIQCSQYTADILTGAGKGHWVRPRDDAVEAKGKGVLETFWVMPGGKNNTSATSTGNSSEASDRAEWSNNEDPIAVDRVLQKRNRLVDWITELFAEHIKNIIAKRKVQPIRKQQVRPIHPDPEANGLDEVVERIQLSDFDEYSATGGSSGRPVEISPIVLSQLHEYLSVIASTYHENPFHNFEHACHVTMSVSKFLKRIVAPSLDLEETGDKEAASKLHDYTHGITSDPIAQFAIVVSAVIHDADHRGISNTQLIKENEELGKRYHNKSVAEQNSLTIGWDLLMSDKFSELRNCIFATDEEMQRFRQVLVNVVLATDIFDKEINAMRKERWSRAFTDSEETGQEPDHSLRATIVIEHIIQASDVSHTMQHWHIYRKWNKRLFHELMLAHRNGRMDANPAAFWYKGELGFFDYYVIPLAKKLKECEVFGVNSDECLNYAVKNRAEWEARGEECVAEMLAEIDGELGEQ